MSQHYTPDPGTPGESSSQGAYSHLPASAHGVFQSQLGPRTKGRPSRARLAAEQAERAEWRAIENAQRAAQGRELLSEEPAFVDSPGPKRRAAGGAGKTSSLTGLDSDEEEEEPESDGSVYGQVRPKRQTALSAKAQASAAAREIAAEEAEARRLARHGAKNEAGSWVYEHIEQGPPVEGGWMPDPGEPEARKAACEKIVELLKAEVDASGEQLAKVAGLLDCPDPLTEEGEAYFAKILKPTSLTAISARIESAEYFTTREFEYDVQQMFTNARRWHAIESREYGAAVTLQRYFHSLSLDQPISEQQRRHHFAGIARMSNGHLPPVPLGHGIAGSVTLHELEFKGRLYKIGTWVHLANAADPSQPIVGQVFKITLNLNGSQRLLINHYARPSETRHSYHHTFMAHEVFKTSAMASHDPCDVLELCTVLLDRKWIKGRPFPSEDGKEWRADEPVYLSTERWRPESNTFIRIKNWVQVVPDEVKSIDNIVPFPEPLAPPPRVCSPFLRGVKGSGHLTDGPAPPGFQPNLGAQLPSSNLPGLSGAPTRRFGRIGPASDPFSPALAAARKEKLKALEAARSSSNLRERIRLTLNSLEARAGQKTTHAAYLALAEDGGRALDVRELALRLGMFGNSILGLLAELQDALGKAVMCGHTALLPPSRRTEEKKAVEMPKSGERKAPTAWDTLRAAGADAYYANLPEATRVHFERDAQGLVKWFPAPPLDGPRQHHASLEPGAPLPGAPMPSLAYLAHAAKRKLEARDEVNREVGTLKRARETGKVQIEGVELDLESAGDVGRAFADSLQRQADHLAQYLTLDPSLA